MAEQYGTRRRLRPTSTFFVVIMFAVGFAACGKASPIAPTTAPAPTSPTPTPTPPAPTPNPPTSISVTGHITETPPTTWTGVEEAVFTITDGPNVGRSAIADFFGEYTLKGLTPGPMTAKVTASDYVSASRTLEGAADTTADFQLMPVAKTITNTIAGDIAADDGTCSDGVGNYPCRIVVFPIHNRGAMDASLTWTSTAGAQLVVTLFQTGVDTPIARSSSSGGNEQHVSATLAGGADYEFRITVAAGTGSANYSLRVTHMN